MNADAQKTPEKRKCEISDIAPKIPKRQKTQTATRKRQTTLDATPMRASGKQTVLAPKATEIPTWSVEGDVVLFGSAQKVKELSNFNRCTVTVDAEAAATFHRILPRLFDKEETAKGLAFGSTEHLWQSFKGATIADVRRFTTDGDVGSCNRDAVLRMVQTLMGKDGEYWLSKNAVGIVPKLAVKPDRARKLGLTLAPGRADDKKFNAVEERALWLQILRLKNQQNEKHRDILLSTKNAHLIEFDRGAARVPSHWGGCRAAGRNVWVGGNAMGKYTMEIRRTMCVL
jgi:hypothetical protein